MNNLQELLLQYTNGVIDYARFRQLMVERFLSVRNIDPAVELLTAAVDAECADLSDGVLAESQIKANLAGLLAQKAFGNVFRFGPDTVFGVRISQLTPPITSATTHLQAAGASFAFADIGPAVGYGSSVDLRT